MAIFPPIGDLRPWEVDVQVGPWRCEALLGEGGMARVYRAQHRHDGRWAALKTLGQGSVVERRALRREAEALADLDHPAVVGLLDADLDAAAPWLALELVEGVPLTQQISTSVQPAAEPTFTDVDLWATPMGADQAQPPPRAVFDDDVRRRLGTLAQVAHALAHLHAAGWVHCDLKPDNVLVTTAGRAVLVDFGLVAWRGPRADPGSIVEVARAAGTAAYLSPERARGEHFDARSDLYALGCMVHEAITGEVPYPRSSAEMSVMAHVHAPLPRLEYTVTGLPSELAELVRALLAKSPADRPGHAQHVLSVLRPLGIAMPDAPLPRHGPLYAPDLVGRDALLLDLADRCGDGFGGSGTATWLLGESGSGKSRLARGVVSELAAVRRPEVLVGGATSAPGPEGPRPSGAPLEAFLGPLRRALDVARSKGKPLSSDAVALVAPFAPFLTDAPVEVPPDLDQIDAGRERLHRAVLELLDPLVHEVPTLWVFDDLQWLDELSRGVLEVLLRRLPDQPWAVLGLARTEGGATLPMRGAEAFDLPPLSDADVETLVEDHLGAAAPEALQRWVRAHAGGNPFFVGECLRTAVAEGFLVLEDRGAWAFARERADDLQAQPLPATLGSLVQLRLAGLPAAARQVAEAAAVLGGCTVALLTAVSGLAERDVRSALGVLARRAVVRPEDDGERVAFVHDRLAEHAYGALEPARRQALHGRAADALEGATVEERAGHLAPWHRERAGQRAEARRGWLAAARAARARFALDEAQAAYEASIALCAEPTEEGEARQELAIDVLMARGRAEEAEGHLERILEVCDDDPAEVLLALANVRLVLDRRVEGMEALARAQVQARRQGRHDLEAKALSERGHALVRDGLTAEGEALHREALARLGEEADPQDRADLLHHLALSLHHQGRQEEALTLFEDCLQLHREAGDLVRQARVLVTLGNTHVFLGRPDEGMARYRDALELHRRLGNRGGEGYVLGNIGAIHARELRPELARRARSEALAIHREVGNRRHEGILLRAVALDKVQAGRLEEGMADLEHSRRVLEEVHDVLWLAHVDAGVGRVHRYLGQPEEARVHLERAEATYDRMGARDLLCDAWLEWVHWAVAFDEDPRPWAERIEAEAAGASDNGIRGRARGAARALVEAWEADGALLAGDHVADLPEGLRRRLEAM